MTSFNPRDLVNKAKDLVGENAETIRNGLDKAESFVNDKTGGKYSDQLNKATDFVSDKLSATDPAASSDPDAPGTRAKNSAQAPTDPA